MNRVVKYVAIPAATAIALLVVGCAVGPDFQRPPAPNVKGYIEEPLTAQTISVDTAGGQAQRFIEGQDIPAQWWTLFHSEPLNRLVEQALKANPNLDAAKAVLRQAQESVYAETGALLPNVNAGGSATRQKTTGAEFGLPNTPGSIFTLYNASINVSYGIDLFGVARRTLESAEAQADFERFQVEAAYLTLTSNVVTTAVQEASLRSQIVTTQGVIDIENQQLNVLQQQFDAGGASKTNVLAQEVLVAQTRASLPPLVKQLALLHNQLATLTGRFPSEEFEETLDLTLLQLPTELPVSLPSKLVEQRPDIRAAEAQLHEANAQIGIATANLFPQLTLNGSIGSDATKFSDMFSSGTGIWSIGANVLQPIFHGGTLIHERRAAIAAHDSAAAQYRSTVLSAFQDVANALRALQSDTNILQAQTQAAQSASESLGIAHKQYEAGAINYLSLLNAQQTYQQTQINLIQARATRYSDTAALFQALGGGWWNRADTVQTAVAEQKATTIK